MIIDSHCHLYDEKLKEIKNDILNNLETHSQIVICTGEDLKSSKECITLSQQNKNVFATVGVHPHTAEEFNNDSINQLSLLAKNKKVVAIGEIGLDYFYEFSPMDIQKKVLKEQIILADKLSLPCVFHVREATKDFLDLIDELSKQYKIRGYVHSFSGSVETLNIYLKHGFYIGINGIITFKNANKMLDIVLELPLDKILIETDAPYLTPVPYRGTLNKPEYVKLVANKIAEIKNLTLEEVITVTTNNAKTFFDLPI